MIASLSLPISPYLSPYLPISPYQVRTDEEMIASLHLPISPHISPYLPISPCQVRTDEEMIAFLETGEVDEIVASNAFIEPWKVRLRSPHLPISPHVSPCLPTSPHN